MGKDNRQRIRNHNELEVYRLAMETAMSMFTISRSFPKDERYSLTDQVRRSSRSICANIAEAWRKRRYEAHFVSKLSDAEAEAAETQVWIEFAVKCKYLDRKVAATLYKACDEVIAMLVAMILHPERWTIRRKEDE